MDTKKATGLLDRDPGEHAPRAVKENGASAPPGAAAPRSGTSPAVRQPIWTRPAFVIFIIILLVLSVGGLFYWLHARHFESTDDAFIEGHVIPISPQVPALVSQVHIIENQFVKKGEPLVDLDPTDYQVALAQAQGAEAGAEGKLEQAKSSVPAADSAVNQAQAELDSAIVSFNNASQDLKRYEGLDARATSRQQLDNATAAQKTAAAAVEQAKARLASARTQVATAKASVLAADGDYKKAQADTHRAEINLGYCHIVAPADGKITGKNVDPGMYVTPASQLFALVPPEVWVIANFKETQLTHMQPGQEVAITVDAYPDRKLHGKVESIQSGTGSRFSVIPAENATGNFVKVVQRVPVKITFDGNVNTDAAHLLSPGMSAEPEVRVHEGDF